MSSDENEQKVQEKTAQMEEAKMLVQVICSSGSATVIPAEAAYLGHDIKDGDEFGVVAFALPEHVVSAVVEEKGTIFFVEVSEDTMREAKEVLKEMRSSIVVPKIILPPN